MKTEIKVQKLKSYLRNLKKVIIAYSGGTDSSFLLKTAFDILKENTAAVIIKSETMFASELRSAEEFANSLSVKTYIIHLNLLKHNPLLNNQKSRCYICKQAMFLSIKKLALNMNIPYILDGTNYDDRLEDRPGRKAQKEFNIISPLLEAGLTKKEIRKLSKTIGIPTADKESNTCLLTRFPFQHHINKKDLKRIEQLENLIRTEYQFQKLRVRYKNSGLIEIEISKKDSSFLDNPLFLSYISQAASYLHFNIEKILLQ